ncbi:MAG: type I DNA topoisomerase [Patescibacteria group bacterium]
MKNTSLIIVESPTKAKTISRFLGKEFKVESSYGHVRDLPKSKLGIDIEKNFEPQYIIPKKAQKNATNLKKEAGKSAEVILATDEDREGEAIAWHISKILGEDKTTKRIVFHEITETAIENALKNPRPINFDLVNAQQARRVMDRLVGYKLSPFLWQKISRGLSAGRVQSVALRLIVEREKEIRNFKPEEYWTVTALLEKNSADSAEPKNFEAHLVKINSQPVPKPGIKNKEEADSIVDDLKKSEFKVLKAEKKEARKNPLPPFTTSTLQQEAVKKLGYSSKKTMFLAQRLYENGLITYMRTDSFNLSRESLVEAKKWINQNLGGDYAGSSPRVFKTKSKLAQEAHEAIRPTDVFKKSDDIKMESADKKIYDLIWRRFVASQLPQAVFSAAAADIEAGKHLLRATGTILQFDGYLKIWPQKFQIKELPDLQTGETVKPIKIIPEQHFTEPPARYNEASLIKTLEEYGIGRPSTYAPTISVIQDRYYVAKNEQRRFQPTEMGETVNKMLTEHFPAIVDIQFTVKMENELDEIAEGKKEWPLVIKEFYEPFSKNLEEKYLSVEKEKPKIETTDQKCEKCGKDMIVRNGRFGKFIACSGFPECKNTKSLNQGKSFGACQKCGKGEIVKKRTKKGRFFYGCSKYPDCDFAAWKMEEKKENAPVEK